MPDTGQSPGTREVPRRTGPPWTPSDIALLERVARGWSTRQISEHTAQSQRLVRAQLRDVRARLGAKNNIHAAVLAVRHGII